jgi:hypothetical protein
MAFSAIVSLKALTGMMKQLVNDILHTREVAIQ